MFPQTTPHDALSLGTDRRRTPRYSCSGVAQISSLPLYGSLLLARVRDLGLGGCCIECAQTVPLLDLGTQTEIVVKVNSWFFRARAHVKSIRGASGISMEFTRMSSGGYSMLADLIADLQTSRTMGSRHACGSERSYQIASRNLGDELDPSGSQDNRMAIVGTIVSSPRDQASRASLRGLHPAAKLLDIFV
jgi:hypothetical protein